MHWQKNFVKESSPTGRTRIRNLNPSIKIKGNEYIAMTQQMAAIPRTILGNVVEMAEFSRAEVLNSIDFLVTGI